AKTEQFTSNQTDDRCLKVHPREPVSNWPSSAKRWALIIGIDNYDDKHIRKLSAAANDATALAQVLEKNAGFPPNQIIVLASDQREERRPTRSIFSERCQISLMQSRKMGCCFLPFRVMGLSLIKGSSCCPQTRK